MPGLENSGQEVGIRTRTVAFTGRDAANYNTFLMEPNVGLAPTTRSLQNCRSTIELVRLVRAAGIAPAIPYFVATTPRSVNRMVGVEPTTVRRKVPSIISAVALPLSYTRDGLRELLESSREKVTIFAGFVKNYFYART